MRMVTTTGRAILLVSADDAAATLLRAQLELRGFRHVVFTAHTLEEAYHASVSHPPALVLYRPPFVPPSGQQFCQTLVERHAVPLVVLGTPDDAAAFGTPEVLPPSCSVHELLRTVTRFVAPEEGVSPPLPTDVYRALFARAVDGILLLDAQTHQLLDVNAQAAHLLEYSGDALRGMCLLDLVPPDEHLRLWQRLAWLTTPGATFGPQPRVHLRQDGSPHVLTTSALLLDVAGQRLLVDMLQEGPPAPLTAAAPEETHANGPGISARLHQEAQRRKRAESLLQLQALYDELTNLPNRRLFMDRLQQALAYAQRSGQCGAVMFLDLDRLKEINRLWGYKQGDSVLQSIASRLTRCLRRSDTVARLGGDEFTILVTALKHTEDATTVAEKLLAAVQQPVTVEAHTHTLNAGIGICVYPQDGTDAETLLRRADAAMSQAKRHGHGRYVYYTTAMGS